MKKTSPRYRGQSLQYENKYTIDVTNALYSMPADLSRDEWVKIAMGYKAAGGDFKEFDAWSSTASNYKSKDCKSMWKSLSTDGGISFGTLFQIAKQYGYRTTDKSLFIQANIDGLREPNLNHKRLKHGSKLHRYKQASQKAETVLDQCGFASDSHEYLVKKRIHPCLKLWVDEKGWLVIPVMDLQGNIHSLQRISPTGEKLFLAGGAIKSHFYQLWSKRKPSKAIVICEGYATGVTLYSHYTPDCSVIVAFNAGNLLPVAQVFRKAFPDAEIIIAGDKDKSGTGQKKAKEAALAVGGDYTLPIFHAHETGSDFNDRWCLDHKEAAA